MSLEIAALVAAKEARRRRLASLRYPDKVRIVVRLQQIIASILRARGRPVCVWKIQELSPPKD